MKARKDKKALLDPKNIGLKNHQNLHFFKGVSPWFLSKNGDFLIFSFYAKWIENKGFLKVGSKNHQFFFFLKKSEPVVFVKKWRFFNLEFYAKWIKKKCFVEVLKEKKPF